MKNWKSKLFIVALSVSIVACNNPTKNKEGEVQDSTALDDTVGAIAVNPLAHAKEFPGATLNIASITAEKVGTDSAKITVKYDVQNFNLTEQTEHEHHMANSHDGQHIHFILDNTPYAALYKPEHSVTVPVNSEHYLLSFLSRSFHESIKTAEASKLIRFKVNADGKVEELPAPTEPSLFYSRPKGDYKGEETKTLLLDFFLANTTLAADGNKVKADINGQEFVLDQWVPYEILNLPLGENTVKLTLVDKDGNALTGDNVSIERKINLLVE
ncbi:hypothetical protein G5B35_25965 [Parapusillimonas sp. SGNA-6]|uniref:hypothetical protein n=1 Tax=Parapedobacter sp. SGR-10 TaxID=2710879 RepID=UPI0013D85D31|nr:hypothetical protein [Parapedobacter sp. SGR-10]NGF57643.1 hypothetical protein [Parapedobacter sp. SGR-10]NGM90752.1 hypothetical protein [Parapusillimonas sp. SGNA-6]